MDQVMYTDQQRAFAAHVVFFELQQQQSNVLSLLWGQPITYEHVLTLTFDRDGVLFEGFTLWETDPPSSVLKTAWSDVFDCMGDSFLVVCLQTRGSPRPPAYCAVPWPCWLIAYQQPIIQADPV
jgi:hypothetical protein